MQSFKKANLKNIQICYSVPICNTLNYLIDADLSSANLKGAYSTEYLDHIDYDESFDKRIKSRIEKETDLSGISGYNSKKTPFIDKPIVDSYTKEEAAEIIKKYKLYSIY